MKHIYSLIFLCSLYLANAQQLPQYTQYMLNDLAINPAVAGKNDYAEMRSNNRYQWSGLTDAPRTYMLTVHAPFRKRNMGLGGHVFTDIVGPTRRVGLNFSYAYHIKLNETMRLSMGLSAGMLQFGIDGSKLVLHDAGDENLLTQYRTVMVPDFGAGVQLHTKKWYVGISVPQLYQSPLQLYDGSDGKGKLATQFIMNAAYAIDINQDFKVEPSFLLKYVKPAPMELDLGARVLYQDQIWLGATYRHNDAFTALVGYMYKNYLMVGYSYDITTSNLRNYSSGTHEIMLGLRFSRKQSKGWEEEGAK